MYVDGVVGQMDWGEVVVSLELVAEVAEMESDTEAGMGAVLGGQLEWGCLLVCWYWLQTEWVLVGWVSMKALGVVASCLWGLKGNPF